jgi:hypothetical protein
MIERFLKIRENSEKLCNSLLNEDYSVQASEFTSPQNLAHTTWFWKNS